MIRFLRVWFAARVLRYADRWRNFWVSRAIATVANHATDAERVAIVAARLREPTRMLALVLPEGTVVVPDEAEAGTQPAAQDLPN